MPEPTPRPKDTPTHGVHVIPGEMPEGVVPPSTSLTPPRPADVPDELIDPAAVAICDKQAHGLSWDEIGHVHADLLRRQAREALAAVLPVHERQVRERVAADIEETADAEGFGDYEAGLQRAARVARQEPHA